MSSNPSYRKATLVLIEYSIVTAISTAMALLGYWSLNKWHGGATSFFALHNDGWTLWLIAVSVATWLWLYRISSNLHWLVLPVMGLLSPFVGAMFFFPLTPFALGVIFEDALIVFPIGAFTGFLVSVSTLPLRPKVVRYRNA